MGSFWATEDVLLELARWLSLRDALVLASVRIRLLWMRGESSGSFLCSQTCSTVRNNLNTRAFWMTTYREMFRRLPDPHLSAMDLSKCSTSKLRHFVRHAVVLHRRWTSPSARPQAKSQFILPPGFRFWDVIKGSPHVLIFNDDTKQIACLNIGHVGGVCSNLISIGEPYMSCMDSISSLISCLAVHTSVSSPEGSTCVYELVYLHLLADTTLRLRINLLSVYDIDIGDTVPSIRLFWSCHIEPDELGGDVHVLMDGRSMVGYAQLCPDRSIQVREWDLSTNSSRMVSCEVAVQPDTVGLISIRPSTPSSSTCSVQHVRDALTDFCFQGIHLRFTVSEARGTHIYVILRTAWAECGALPEDPRRTTTGLLAKTLCIRSTHDERTVIAAHHNELPASRLLELYDVDEDDGSDEFLPLRLAYSAYDTQASSSLVLLPTALIVPLPHYVVFDGAPDEGVHELFSFHERGLVFVSNDYVYGVTPPSIKIVHLADTPPDVVDPDGVFTCVHVYPT
jgi:hypothetical protein